MMKGLHNNLQAGGLRVGDKRIGRILRQDAPGYHGRRRQLAHRQINPMPYYAQYPGHKMPIDQNEKLVKYGTTHVLAIDFYSGFILGLITMPVKNNHIIYDHLFRPILQQFGLWDQIRVNHERESSIFFCMCRNT